MSDQAMPSHISPNKSAQQASGSNGGPTPNPRSCVTCRRRKVKCDKKNPCSNCARANIECIFPGPGRAPRKSRKPPDAELLERLRRLEGVVTSLNAQVEGHEQEAADRERERQNSAGAEACTYSQNGVSHTLDGAKVAADNSVEGLENRFGRLVVEKGRSRYINNSFWASLNNEVEDLKAILIEPSDDEEDARSPESSNTSQHHQGFVFGYSSAYVDMQSLHPPERQARDFWAVYKENVDALVKVLHIPTIEPVIFKAFAHIDKTGKGLEALLFAIYYGAVTSTTPEDCLERWAEDRSTLLSRYRFGLEQALARANFLYCDEVVVLQAFVVYLILLRRNDDARKIWTLTGLVVRISQTLGIHRDGSHFGLPPFETEMRRRLWWQVCMLDARSSEDHGCDPTIVEAQFDTKMPLNVNDADLRPDMTEFPEEREGFTDMTFCLLRFEIANILRRIVYIPPGPNKCTDYFSSLTIEQKEKWISDCHQAMERKYLKNCDMTIPLCWVTATISRLIMSKMWLIVYHPHQRKDGGASLPQETKDKLFITSLENIEYSILLETEARTMKWGWLFRTYVQWHAIAFLLSELCVRTKGEAVDRAWRALEATAGRWWFPLSDVTTLPQKQQGCLWKPLRKLLAKAKAARDRELALERASMALRNGQFSFDFPNAIDQIGLPNIMTGKQSPESLDSMLRPAGPKLGELPVTERPSWPTSPTSCSTRVAFATKNASGNGLGRQQPLPSEAANGLGGQRRSTAGQEFGDLLNFGLDTVFQDILQGDRMDVLPGNKYASFDQTVSPPTTSPHSNSPHALHRVPTSSASAQPFGRGAAPTAANGYPTFGDGMFPATSMNLSPDGNGRAANLAVSGLGSASGLSLAETANVDDGEMDWTVWDDMVSQYGVEGFPSNPASTAGPGNLGLVHWF